MSIEEYLDKLGFIKNKYGKYICQHQEPMFHVGGQELEFCIKELLANFEGTSTLIIKSNEPN